MELSHSPHDSQWLRIAFPHLSDNLTTLAGGQVPPSLKIE